MLKPYTPADEIVAIEEELAELHKKADQSCEIYGFIASELQAEILQLEEELEELSK